MVIRILWVPVTRRFCVFTTVYQRSNRMLHNRWTGTRKYTSSSFISRTWPVGNAHGVVVRAARRSIGIDMPWPWAPVAHRFGVRPRASAHPPSLGYCQQVPSCRHRQSERGVRPCRNLGSLALAAPSAAGCCVTHSVLPVDRTVRGARDRVVTSG